MKGNDNYLPYQTPNSPYIAQPDATYVDISKWKDYEKQSFFKLLDIDKDGIGDYHVNHFICYFRNSKKIPTVTLLKDFYNSFPVVFSLNNEAEAIKGSYIFEGNSTIKFEIGGNLSSLLLKMAGTAHEDWVSMKFDNYNKTFFASTLKRLWQYPFEKIFNSEYPNLVEVSQRHFLAGRRSWSIGYMIKEDLYYIDTAAFERTSHVFYNIADDTFQTMINKIWINLLNNYIVYNKFNKEYRYDGNLEGYNNEIGVRYKIKSYQSPSKARSDSWFIDILKNHPGLFIGNVKSY